jgi:hypothetical protein
VPRVPGHILKGTVDWTSTLLPTVMTSLPSSPKLPTLGKTVVTYMGSRTPMCSDNGVLYAISGSI